MKKSFAKLILICCSIGVGYGIIKSFFQVHYYQQSNFKRFTAMSRYFCKNETKFVASEPKTKGVIIFTSMRSGSTFLGELFNQYSRVFYLFEPLHPFGFSTERTNLRTQALLDIMKCNFSRIPENYINAVNTFTKTPDKSSKCAIDGICYKFKSEFLKRDTDLCPNGVCEVPFDSDRLSLICRRSLLPVVKIVAEPSLESLQPLMENPTLGIRVIHLVRDPRAVINSFRNMEAYRKSSEPYIVKEKCKYVCKNLVSNVLYGGNNNWPGRYMRIRHEDFSQDPIKIAKQVYNFVGLNFDTQINDWLIKNTKTNTGDNVFKTKRNSMETVSRWRSELSFEEISAIQEKCRIAMERLNYKEISKPDDVNNTSLDLWW